MARVPDTELEQEPDKEPTLPEGAAHVIVAHNDMRGPPPEGYPEDVNVLKYFPGDELPFEYGKRSFEGWEARLAVLDENGEHLAGGVRQRGGISTTDALTDRYGSGESPEAAIEIWKSGEGFDPTEYGD